MLINWIFLAPWLLGSEKSNPMKWMSDIAGPNGLHAQFLHEYGPFLLKKYTPKAIVVFSAHYETSGTIEGNTSAFSISKLLLISLYHYHSK
jgi:aromatic ring-opening dioxygenase catalytic subunit (LigB family)